MTSDDDRQSRGNQDGGGAPLAAVDRHQRRGHRLSKAIVGIPLLAATSAWVGRAARAVPHAMNLPQPVVGQRHDIQTGIGRIATYSAGPVDSREPPLLLIHSINAAASAFEIGPIYERSLRTRRVYALDLPGYGFSDRREQIYTPRIMTDAILAMIEEIARLHGRGPIDALALSLSSEFLARAALENPAAFRSIALVSPTGFDRRGPRNGPAGTNRGMPKLYKAFTFGLWRRGFFDLLTSRISIRYFLEKTFGSKTIDEDLLEFDYVTTHQPRAEYAPYSFISGFLFSRDIGRIYDALRLPAWLVHGVRGDFTDYSGKSAVEGRPNWTVEVMPTGALPQFEMPDAFQTRFEAFLKQAPHDLRPVDEKR